MLYQLSYARLRLRVAEQLLNPPAPEPAPALLASDF